LPDAAFQHGDGTEVAIIDRSNSFPWPRNSYREEKFIAFYFERLADGMPHALTKADEVARNGVLQRITSARGFLGHPLLK
jgi:hypothetical protein